MISKQTDTAGNIINVPDYINDKGYYHRVVIDANKLATVFGREELRNYIRKELRVGNLVKIKNRSHLTSDLATEIDAQYGKNASAWETPDNSNPTTMVAQYETDVSNSSISDSTEKSNTFSENSSENSGKQRTELNAKIGAISDYISRHGISY